MYLPEMKCPFEFAGRTVCVCVRARAAGTGSRCPRSLECIFHVESKIYRRFPRPPPPRH